VCFESFGVFVSGVLLVWRVLRVWLCLSDVVG